MTKASDEHDAMQRQAKLDLAKEVGQCAKELNQAIIKAVAAGLDVSVNLQDYSRFMAGNGQVVEVAVSERLLQASQLDIRELGR